MSRQFMEKRLFGGDPKMSQLHAIAYYSPDERSGALSGSHFCCHDVDNLHEFREAVLSSSAYIEKKDLAPHHSEIIRNPV